MRILPSRLPIPLVLFVATALLFFSNDAFADHSMPRIIGKSERQAVQELEALGLQVDVVTIAGVSPGRVSSQSPDPGATVADGDTVEITVGVRMVIQTIAPRVIGFTERRAVRALEDAYYLQIQHVPGPRHQHGRVISQVPPPGAEIPFRGVFRLKIVQSSINVPMLVGRTEAGARQILDDVGLSMQVRYVRSQFAARGTVISQLPNTGAAMQPGGVVDVAVAGRRPSGGGDRSRVPHVVGLAMQDAEQEILAQGLVPHVHFVNVSGQPAWSVVSQEVPGGRRVQEGDHVGFDVVKPSRMADGVRVPVLYGMEKDHALDLLTHLDLKASFREQASRRPVGTILQQGIRPGTLVPSGTTFRVIIAAEPPRGWRAPIGLVPEVRGLRPFEAHVKLLAAGFRPRMQRDTAPGQAVDRVFRQDPDGGSRKTVGERVLYYLPYRANMPDLARLTRTQAIQALEAAGLTANAVRSGPPHRGAISEVISQEHPVGEVIARGSTVSFRFRMKVIAQPLTRVPSVIGLSKGEASRRLTAAGFRAVLRSNTYGTGRTRVVTQSPVAGSLRPAGHTIEAIYQFTGIIALPTVEVPRVIGLEVGEATRRLEAHGLVVRVVRSTIVSPGVPTSRIIAQDRVAGSRVARGSTVTITQRIGIGVVQRVIVPNVVGMRVDRAIRRLKDAGFEVRTSGIGVKVRSQSPAAGTRQARGSRVKIKLKF